MNKLSFIKSGLVALAALALAGCSKTEEFKFNPDSALQIESVSGISPFALMQEPASKAVITGDSLPGDEAAKGIGLSVTASDGGAYDGHDSGYTNVNFTNSGSGWSTATPVYLSDTHGKLYGYFPYNSEANDLRAVPVQSSLNGTDYLYAEPLTVSHSNKSVSLQMKHALSRLHLTIKKGANFAAEAPLSKIILKSTAIDATGTMNLTTGAITASKKSGENGTVEFSTDGTITAEGIVNDILLVPADGSEGKKDITIILTIAGKPTEITLSGNNGLDIRSGIQNNVTLTIEDTGIKVSGVGVGVWSEGGSQTVQVGSHIVMVKLADDIPASDVLISTYVEGDNVKIKAVSTDGYGLDCSRDDHVEVPATNVSNGFHTFALSDISRDVVVTIGYITVKFDLNGRSGTAPAEIIVAYNQTISDTIPNRPPLSVFLCWCTTPECNTPYNFSQGVTKDITLYAKWADGVNGHAYVELAGAKWATENVGGSNVPAALFPGIPDNVWGFYYYVQENALAAAQSWGCESGSEFKWTLPSKQQWDDLIKGCHWEYTSSYNYSYSSSPNNGKPGWIAYKAINDEDKGNMTDIEGYTPDTVPHIFLPAAHLYQQGYRINQGSGCFYWSKDKESCLYSPDPGSFPKINEMMSATFGLSVRPVLE